ncbi:MAG: hypothetical protein ACW980_12385 [Promethearchaeota archaeon]
MSIPHSSHFSIGTSPYYAHQHGLAIDIYQSLTLEPYEVISPIAGKVLKIKSVIAPRPKFSGGIDKDYLILVNNPSNPDIVWKMMHVKPDLQIGDEIKVGDHLGITIRNGYFAYWSSPHLHLEIRPFNNAIRATGGIDFSLNFNNSEILRKSNEDCDTIKVPIKIHSIYPEIILAYLPDRLCHKISPFFGLNVSINHKMCLLDGGIPHYRIGTVLSNQNFQKDIFDSVYIGNLRIGTLHEINRQFGFLKFNKLNLSINDRAIRGISLYLANFSPLIKLIPYKKNEFNFKPNSIQSLSLILEN